MSFNIHSYFSLIFTRSNCYRQTRDTSVAQGRTFYGAGSASEVEAGEPYGGTLYGYNQTHALLWTPAASYGNPIYVDGIWGDGMDPLHIVSVSITVKVIATGAIPIRKKEIFYSLNVLLIHEYNDYDML